MLPISFTAFEMIIYSVIAAIYIFNGYRFRYIIPLSLTISIIVTSSLIYRLFFSSNELLIAPTSFLSTTLILLFSFIFSYSINRWIPKGRTLLLTLFSALSFALIISTTFFYSSFIEASLIIAVIELLLLFLMVRFIPSHFIIILTTTLGSAVLSTIFADFYYFSLPVHIILFIVLLAGGVITQEMSERKRGEKQHDE